MQEEKNNPLWDLYVKNLNSMSQLSQKAVDSMVDLSKRAEALARSNAELWNELLRWTEKKGKGERSRKRATRSGKRKRK